jgi:hypothetical protein
MNETPPSWRQTTRSISGLSWSASSTARKLSAGHGEDALAALGEEIVDQDAAAGAKFGHSRASSRRSCPVEARPKALARLDLTFA